MKNKGTRLLAAPYLIWMGGFIVIPLLLVWYYAFTDKTGAFTLDNLTKIFLWENYKPLYLAVLLSLCSTLLCFLLAFPLAMVLRNRKVGKGSFVAFIFIPLLGYMAACYASPLAWIFADAFLIPAFFKCMKRLKRFPA